MTTIVGAVCDDGSVVLGADGVSDLSGYAAPGSTKLRSHPVSTGDPGRVVLLGAAGRSSLGDVVSRGWTLSGLPDPGCTDDSADAFAEACAEAVAELAATATPPVLDDGSHSVAGGILLGAVGRLWYLNNQAAHPVYRGTRFYAVGSGASVALGYLDAALHPGERTDVARGVVADAIRCAARWDATTNLDHRGPIVRAIDERCQLVP